MPSRALTFLQEIRDAIERADRLLLIAGPGTQLGDSPQNYPSEPVGTARLRQVLDDVWQPDHAKPFLVGGPRYRLLITTRLYEVVSAVSGNERKVGALPTEKALALLSNWAVGIPETERDTALDSDKALQTQGDSISIDSAQARGCALP